MAAGAASNGLFRAVFDGCISCHDTGIQRRPYHRNCSCALHKLRGHFPRSAGNMVSYPIRRSWSEGCLALATVSTATAAATTAATGNALLCSPPICHRGEYGSEEK